ncbi:hypothetical protein TNCV_5124561 [Trichonephila clavipes]|nr:hypothetical protein TNCV_5124561 [Trichonephila clavipes]
MLTLPAYFASYRNRDPKHNIGHASNGNRDPKDNVGQGGSGAHGASNGNPTGNVDQPTPHADVDSNGNRDPKNNVGCSQLASLDKNNALREIKLRLPYLQGKSTTMSVIAHQTEKEWISANERKADKECHKHRLRAQQSNMQPDLRKLICEHIIRVLQHQKDVNQKQHICVKHEFVVYILKDNWGRWKQHSRTLRGSFMARRKPRVLTLGQS